MKTALFYSIFAVSILVSANTNASSWMHYDDDNSPLPSNTVNAVFCDEDGTWIGTDNGLAHFNGSTWQIYDSETSELPDNNVRDIHKDIAGNIWVATDEGILKITETDWEIMNSSNSGLPSNNVRTVSTDSEGNLWVGTWGNGIARLVGNQWTHYTTVNSDLPSDGIFTVEVDYLGHVWVGSFNGGVSKFDGQTWITYNTDNSELPHNHVRTIVFDHSNIMWFGTDDGLARKTPGGHWDIHDLETIGFTFHTVFDGVLESPGKVYFATDGGILQFNQSNFNMITAQNSSLISDHIRAIDQGPNGNLWLGTGSAGISIYLPNGNVGVKEPLKGADIVTVYPNPTVNEISFLLPNKGPVISEVLITNVTGQAVMQKAISSSGAGPIRLDVRELTQGAYQLTVVSPEGIAYSKFLKQ